jgi:proteasome assembly chaperone (PAC2) family protein
MYCNASGCLRHQVPGQYFCEIHAAAEVAENESDALEILETAREEHGRLDNWRKAGEAGVVLGLVGLTVVIFAAILLGETWGFLAFPPSVAIVFGAGLWVWVQHDRLPNARRRVREAQRQWERLVAS